SVCGKHRSGLSASLSTAHHKRQRVLPWRRLPLPGETRVYQREREQDQTRREIPLLREGSDRQLLQEQRLRGYNCSGFFRSISSDTEQRGHSFQISREKDGCERF